jgi:hypothetical protein
MKVAIVGAGVSGLTAAIELEKAGAQVSIYDADHRIGGRLKTDIADGVPYDYGFQVLQTAYPLANEYLDFEALNLKKFKPGAVVFIDGKAHKIGDALRDGSFLISSVQAPVGSLIDKKKVLDLANKVKKMSLEEIFSLNEQSTLSYLKDFGFSDKIIDRFFRPFYSGIFFETELNTSARKFLFTYKMFSEGFAAIPNGGIQEIPKQLESKLSKTEIHLNAHVETISNGSITLNGQQHEFDFVINAANNNSQIEWLSCDNLYFKAPKPKLDEPILGLITNKKALINNLHYVSEVQDIESSDNILSVTVVGDHGLEQSELITQIQSELKAECQIENTEFIKRFTVKHALPNLKEQRYAPQTQDLWLDDKTLIAGDHTCNASLNSAMLSGKMAAQAVLAK